MLLTPSPVSAPVTGHSGFSRWSTSRLNSTHTSTSTSPCGSTRSSFNYRQPYLGWRSQERLSKPRTPAERLAAGILPATSPTSSTKGTSPQLTPSTATTPILGPQQHHHPLIQQQVNTNLKKKKKNNPRWSIFRIKITFAETSTTVEFIREKMKTFSTPSL